MGLRANTFTFAHLKTYQKQLFQTAEDNALGFFSLVLDAVRRNFYVNNCLNSVNSGLKVIGSINELTLALRRGRFEWLSNCLAVSFDVSVSCADSTVSLGLDNEEILHVQGGKWNYVEAELHTNRSLMEVFFRCRARCLNVLACWHFLLFLLPPNNKCINKTCPGDKPEKQGVVRNQLVVPRWSDGSETIKKIKSTRLPLLKPNFSVKTPQPNLISLDVCGQRKTNFSHAAYFSSSVASTVRNSSSSSTSCR